MFMSKSEMKALTYYLLFLVLTLLMVTVVNGCSGWSVMGYNLDGANDSVFNEVIQDSITHYYHDIRVGKNWCFYHAQYELVELVSE